MFLHVTATSANSGTKKMKTNSYVQEHIRTTVGYGLS